MGENEVRGTYDQRTLLELLEKQIKMRKNITGRLYMNYSKNSNGALKLVEFNHYGECASSFTESC